MKIFKEFFVSISKNRLVENFLSLSILQLANYILPFITLPYLVRVLGVDKYGFIAFAQAFINYFQIITDYGFNLSATKEISINRDNKEKISEIFCSVIIIKLILLLLSLILMTIIVFSFEKFYNDWLIYYITFGIVLGQTLFPLWFFQGMERMKYITLLNVFAKLIFTIAIFIIIKQQSDYIYVPLLNSLGFILSGLLALVLVFKNFDVKFRFPSIESLKFHLKKGWHLFLSQVNIAFFNNTNVIFLGLITNNTSVGYYSAAEKLIRVIMGLQIPLVNAIYPTMSKLLKEDANKAILFGKKVLLFGSFIYLVLIIILYFFLDAIVILMFGSNFEESSLILKILLIIPVTVFINNIYGTQFLINIGHSEKFFNVILVGGLLNLVLCPIMTYFFDYIGTAISWTIIEILILIGMYYYTTKYIHELKLKYLLKAKK
jgi:PST family polysaccharide transporter